MTTRIATAIACATVLAGCAQAPIYSPERDKQGQAIKKAWSEVDTQATIAAARDNLAALRDRELATYQKSSDTRRDTMFREMATGGTVATTIAAPTDRAFKLLLGDAALAAAWDKAQKKQARAEAKLAFAVQEFSDTGLELPPCADLVAAKPEAMKPLNEFFATGTLRATAAKKALPVVIDQCNSDDLRAVSLVPVSGQIAATISQIKDESDALETARGKTRDLRNEYRAVSAQYEKADAERKSGPDAEKQVRKAADKLKEIADKLGKANDAFSDRFISEERLDSLTGVLEMIAQSKPGDPPPEDAGRAAKAAILLSKVLQDTRNALADAKSPTLAPILLEKNFLSIKVDAATRDIASREASVAALRSLLAMQNLQVSELWQAKTNLQAMCAGIGDMKIADALNNPTPPHSGQQAKGQDCGSRDRTLEDKKRLLKAGGYFIDAQTRVDMQVKTARTRAVAAKYETALGYAEANAAQWNALISGGVDQLADYGASGVRAEQITALLNSLTLLWIGVGVNK